MAYEIPGLKLSLVAGATMTTKQYYAVDVSASTRGYCKIASDGEQAPFLGILQNKPKINQPAEIIFSGVSKAYTDGTVVQDSYICATTDGIITVATSTEYRMGWCIDGPTSTGSTGQLLTVLIKALGPSSGLST